MATAANPLDDPGFGSNLVPPNPLDDPNYAPPRSAWDEIKAGGARMGPAASRSLLKTTAGTEMLAGKPVDADTQAGLDKTAASLKANAPDTVNHNWITNAAAAAPEFIGGMASMAGSQLAGEGVGAVASGPAAPAGAVVGGAAAMAAQQKAESYYDAMQEAKAANLSDRDAEAYATKESNSSARLAGAFGLIPGAGPVLRAGGKAIGVIGKKTAAEVGADVTKKSFGKELAKNAAEGQAGFSGYSAAQGVASNENKKEAGLPSVSGWDAAMGGLAGSAGGIAFLPFHALRAHTDVKTALKTQATLNNEKAIPVARARAVESVYDAMEKDDPNGAQMFKINAAEAIKQGKPIGLDDSWTTGAHESVFPERGEPDQEDTMGGEGGGQEQGTEAPAGTPRAALPAPGDVAQTPGEAEGPFPITQQHATNEAADANTALWAARDAKEQERQRLAASGPLGRAAAAGMDDGGIVDQKAAERQAEVDQSVETTGAPKQSTKPVTEADKNIAAWSGGSQGLSLEDAQARAAAGTAEGRPYSVIPHPQGGYDFIPTALITPELAKQHAGLQTPTEAQETQPTRPLDAEAAQKRADDLTAQTGQQHEVVPSKINHELFDVQKKPLSTEREQPGIMDKENAHALEEHPAGEVGTQPDRGEGAGRPDEGSGVGRGDTEGKPVEEGAQGQAAGEERDIAQGVQQDLNLYGARSGEPTVKSRERGTVLRATKEAERSAFSTLLKTSDAAGHNMSMFKGANLVTYDPVRGADGQITNAMGKAMPQSGTIAIRADILQDMHNGVISPKEVLGYLRHEGWHLLDFNGKDALASSTHPAFDIHSLKTSRGIARGAKGGILKEALAAWRDKNTAASEALDYPFSTMWEGRAKDHGFANEGEMTKAIKNEVFAQLGRMHDEHPEFMKAELPKAFALFEEIRNGTESGHTSNEARGVVQQALRATGADGGRDANAARGAEPADTGGSIERDARKPVGREAGEQPTERAADGSERAKPGEHVVNIGLAVKDGKKVTPADAVKALQAAGVRVTRQEVRQSDTEPTLIASLDRPLTPEEAHQVSVALKQEAIAQKTNGVGELYGPGADNWKPFNNKFFLDHTPLKEGGKGAKFTTEEEKARLQAGREAEGDKRVEKFAKNFEDMPAGKEYQHAALEGRAARGWYKRSREAIEAMYGKDAPRFTSLLAALSPQQDVPNNFYNSLKVWNAWLKAGRPTSIKEITDILNKNLTTPEGARSGKEAMDAYVKNSLRALVGKEDVQLSGPKVESFRSNLRGNMNEVTNDRHNKAFSGILADILSGTYTHIDEFGGVAEKDYGYIAMSAKYREAAAALTKSEGEHWSPAEVQETSWSIWRTLYELATAKGEKRSALQLIKDGALTHELISAVPDFGKLIDTERAKQISRGQEQGRESNPVEAARLAAASKAAPRETGPVANTPAVRSIANRLDRLIASRKALEQDTAFDKANKELQLAGNDAHVDVAPREAGEDNLERNLDKYGNPDTDRVIAEKAPFDKNGTISAQMLRNWIGNKTKDGTIGREELAWSGLDDYLKLWQEGATNKLGEKVGTDRISKDQVQKFLDQHGVKVEETMLGEREAPDGAEIMRETESPTSPYAVHDRSGEVIGRGKTPTLAALEAVTRLENIGLQWQKNGDDAKAQRFFARAEAMNEHAEHLAGPGGGTVKYADRVLPGGKNYRELLLTLPTNESREVSNSIPPSQKALNATFKSSHFDQPNILAHVRFNERTDANGKKVLFIEELQSDWAQQGRKEGFENNNPNKLTPAEFGRVETLANAGNPVARRMISGVPKAPFVGKTEAWTALALKRMIRYAAENGFDRVAWTNGEQQAARYDLSNEVNGIRWSQNPLSDVRGVQIDIKGRGNEYITVDKNGVVQSDMNPQLNGRKLDEVVGKDIAKRILDEPKGEAYDDQLKVGGEGMKSFYDKIVPNVANDVLKKLGGGRVGEVQLHSPTLGVRGRDLVDTQTNETVSTHHSNQRAMQELVKNRLTQQGFDITPQMKRDVAGTDSLERNVDDGRRESPQPEEEKQKSNFDLTGYKTYGGVERQELPKQGLFASLQKLVAPASRGPIAWAQAGLMRMHFAQAARESEMANAHFKEYAKLFNSMSQEDQIKFTNNYERGIVEKDLVLREIAKEMHQFNTKLREEIQTLAPDKLKDFDDNWLGRIWLDKEGKVSSVFARRPLEGSKNFLKRRVYDYFSQGIEAGLKPITYNPVEMMLLKGTEQRRFISGQRIFQEMKNTGVVAAWEKGEQPEGFTALNDKIANAGAGKQYYAPDEAATLFNNHLSPGLQGNGIYDAIRGSGMLLNSAQLGLSAFHLGFTTLDSMVSKAALGVSQLSRGQFLSGIGNIAQSINPAYPFINAMKGDKLLRAYLGELKDPSLAPIVEALVHGGGRTRMDEFYRNSTLNGFKQAINRNDKLGAAKAFIPTVMDRINAPIFEQLVPRQKLGVFFDLAKDWLERNDARLAKMPPEQAMAEKRQAMGKFWDSVDNRMGQLAYDNVFWNRTLKDSLMIGVRSVGWNLGTFRELGGGVLDLKDITKTRELSSRTAYLIALPFVTALMGSMIGYMYTGKGPDELKDYFFPKTGKKRPDGTLDRLSLPSYMKDIFEYGHDIRGAIKYGGDPTKTLQNKLHPLLGMMVQMAKNEDFFGASIRSPGDNAVQQLEDEAMYLVQQATPFGMRNYKQQAKTAGVEPSVGGYLTSPSMIGVTPSPGYITKTDQQEEASAAGRMKDANIAKFRQELQNGAAPAIIYRRAIASGLRPAEVSMVMRQGLSPTKSSRLPPRQLDIGGVPR